MSQQLSPWIEGAYGWDFGESGWNSGMDTNLIKFSFLFDRNVDSVVASLPSAVNGQAHYLTTDNRLYFAVGTTYFSTVVPKWFTVVVRSDGSTWQYNGVSLVQVENTTQLSTRLDAVEVVISTLGTAAFENVETFATFNQLSVLEGQTQAYTDTLRSDLANDSDQALGAALVGRSTVSVDGIANLPALGIVSSLYSVASYYEGGIDGGLLYKYDPLVAKSTHDGGVVISPTVPWDGLRASVDNFLTGVGETDPSGFGCFVAATDVLTPENYGADGTGDETTIFEKLLNAYPARPALEIYIKNVHTVTRQLYVTRPHHIYGNGRGTSKIISSALTLTAPAPLSCGLLVVSSDALSTSGGPITLPAVYVGTSGLRAHIEKLSVESSGNVGIIRGVTANAQCTLDTLLVSSFPSDGISVLASATGTLDGGSYFGNANGTVIQNCSSAFNGGRGYYQKGTDANACMLNRNVAFSNTGSGFLDDSLLGNTHVMCETDGNGAGYDWTAQPRPTYFACYAEGNQGGLEWNGPISSRVSIFSYQGIQPKAGLAYLGGMTGGSMRAGAELRYADTDQIAFDKGAGATPSTYMGVSKDGIEYRARAADASTFRLTGSYSTNYTSFGFGFGPSIHFPPVSVAGNVIAGRPFFPSGASFGTDSAITGSGTAAPVSGTYSRGAIQLNSTPSAGGFIGWVCVTSGTPGTWKTFGVISA